MTVFPPIPEKQRLKTDTFSLQDMAKDVSVGLTPFPTHKTPLWKNTIGKERQAITHLRRKGNTKGLPLLSRKCAYIPCLQKRSLVPGEILALFTATTVHFSFEFSTLCAFSIFPHAISKFICFLYNAGSLHCRGSTAVTNWRKKIEQGEREEFVLSFFDDQFKESELDKRKGEKSTNLFALWLQGVYKESFKNVGAIKTFQ